MTERLSISTAFGYTDATYSSVLPQSLVAPSPLQAGTFKGVELPKTPKTKFNISPRYEIPLADDRSLVLLADYTHTADLWNDAERTYLLRRPATDSVNASIAYKNENWDLTFGGTNLTDERYLVTGHAQIGGGVIYGTYSRPREWYLTLHVRQ